MQDLAAVSSGQQRRALWLSTLAFTACFAVWTLFSIIGIQIKRELGLNDTQFGVLIATPILTGSLSRLVLGIWTEQFGGRRVLPLVMLASAAAAWLLTSMTSYTGYLLAALVVGLAGGSFASGVTYVSKWFPAKRQGIALGIFGAGNLGAAVTMLLAPMTMVAYGWHAVAQIWAAVLAVMAVVFFVFTRDEPQLALRRTGGAQPVSFARQIEPLKNLQVWRFSLYYFFVFGGFVALALWLPRYLIGAYGVGVTTAGMLGAAFSIPAGLFRIAGGWLSDKIGARKVMYATFTLAVICTFLLSYPATRYTVTGIQGDITFSFALGLLPFTVLIFILGFFMSLGSAAIYKHIPVYYPNSVGAVGGVVGMIGGLGGFVLPIAFGVLNDVIGVWTSCFMLLFVLVSIALLWMHFTIRRMEREHFPQIQAETDLPEMMMAGDRS